MNKAVNLPLYQIKILYIEGEALGGVRASIQQTKSNIPRLKSNIISIEAETDNVLKENDFNTRQIPVYSFVSFSYLYKILQ